MPEKGAVDEPGILRPLCRNPTGPDPAKERRLASGKRSPGSFSGPPYTGQPGYPPKSEGRRDPETHRCVVRFPVKAVHWTPLLSLALLPPYAPDLNPIEMAFAKINTLIRKAAAKTYDQLWQASGNVCNLFKDAECYNFIKAAGYETN